MFSNVNGKLELEMRFNKRARIESEKLLNL